MDNRIPNGTKFYTPYGTIGVVVNYDDVSEIRKLYSRRTCVNLYLDYSVKTSKKGKEILVSNLEIPPMEQEQIKVG